MSTVTGRTYTKTRPRGFISDWKPADETLQLLDQVRGVLDTYRAELPLTNRQIFYRLVGTVHYPKTEQAYARLSNKLVLARRAGLIDFSAIRDDGTQSQGSGGWHGPDSYFRSLHYWARNYYHWRADGQPKLVEVWVEAGGMLPQVARVAGDYGLTTYSAGGFNGVTDKYETAQRLAGENRPSVILHIGDWDPSGASIIDSLAEDVTEFVTGLQGRYGNTDTPLPVFKRIAVKPEQIEEFGLETAPQKHTDQRGEWMDETVQAEAIAPDQLGVLVRQAIEAETDLEQLAYVRSLDDGERAAIQERLSRL